MTDPTPLPPNIQPRKRRTNLMLQIENNHILEMMRTGATDAQIRQELKLGEHNYRARIKKLQQEDFSAVLAGQSIEARAQLLENCKRTIKMLMMHASYILTHSTNDIHKMAAMDRIRQYSLDLAKLSSEGPQLFRIINNGLYRGYDKPAANESGDDTEQSQPAREPIDKNCVA